MTLFKSRLRMKQAIKLGADHIKEEESEACLAALAARAAREKAILEVEGLSGRTGHSHLSADDVYYQPTTKGIGFVFSIDMLDDAFLEMDILREGIEYKVRVKRYRVELLELERNLMALHFRSVPWGWRGKDSRKHPHGWLISHYPLVELHDFREFWLCGDGGYLCDWLKV